MQYHSTRDSAVSVSAARAITQGISKDGGLFVPEEFPSLTALEIAALVDCSYVERATYVLSKYLTDFTADEVKECAEAAYSEERFRSPAIAPMKKLDDGMHILELWHGPT
ncbi:MAG: threonine synthase, partial [Clostridia bacterium]|nr:threonine synthase [Clostridia bacterium]